MQTFFVIFRLSTNWNWESLSHAYLNGPHLTLDCDHLEGGNEFAAPTTPEEPTAEGDFSFPNPGSDGSTLQHTDYPDSPTEDSIPPKVTKTWKLPIPCFGIPTVRDRRRPHSDEGATGQFHFA